MNLVPKNLDSILKSDKKVISDILSLEMMGSKVTFQINYWGIKIDSAAGSDVPRTEEGGKKRREADLVAKRELK